jgi:hypothetical protein
MPSSVPVGWHADVGHDNIGLVLDHEVEQLGQV